LTVFAFRQERSLAFKNPIMCLFRKAEQMYLSVEIIVAPIPASH